MTIWGGPHTSAQVGHRCIAHLRLGFTISISFQKQQMARGEGGVFLVAIPRLTASILDKMLRGEQE